MSANIWQSQLNAPKCGTYMPLKKIRMFEHMGMLGASGQCPNAWGIQTYGGCPDSPNIWGCQVNAPKCKSYMPLKKIRGVSTYGGVGVIRGHPNAWGGATDHYLNHQHTVLSRLQ